MNKPIIILAALILIGITACKKDPSSSGWKSETISMGANSASDVYFSLAGGTVKTVNRSDWDIAFSTPTQSAIVLINEGAGVELYCVGGLDAWESVDENTITGLSPRYNDKTGWTSGAFNRNYNAIDPFNFGWGHYNMVDHNVYGDSIYVIKLTDNSFKKFAYRERIGTGAVHYLSWSNLDGSDSVAVTVVATPYIGSRNFIHYSIVNQEIVEAEPMKNEWDLLFTRYVAQIPAGPGVIMDYPVMGVLTNATVTVSKAAGLPADKAVESDGGAYSDNADAIGYDWKVSDPVTHEVTLVDSLSYFIRATDGITYQLYFTEYGGNTQGTVDVKIKTIE
jgi:hypothetical protein